MPKIKRVDKLDKYYHVRFRPPSQFELIRIPDWAARVADSVSSRAMVKMGKTKQGGNWLVQSVMITKDYHDKRGAKRLARKVVKKIEEN